MKTLMINQMIKRIKMFEEFDSLQRKKAQILLFLFENDQEQWERFIWNE